MVKAIYFIRFSIEKSHWFSHIQSHANYAHLLWGRMLMLPAIDLHSLQQSKQANDFSDYISTQIGGRVEDACGTLRALTAMTRTRQRLLVPLNKIKSSLQMNPLLVNSFQCNLY